uniref:Uncharacterized protein n=1 Tax=Panagrolaimus sp. PS1159 TaxID=55785 RepID=A0AC35FRW3_9BILA
MWRNSFNFPNRTQLHAPVQARRAKKKYKKNGTKSEREIINSAADANSPDTISLPNLQIQPQKLFRNQRKNLKSKNKNVAEKEQISEQKDSNSDKSAKERSDREKPAINDGSDKIKKFVRSGGGGGGADDGSERRNRNDAASERC